MKRLFSLLFIIVFSQGYSQITFKGVKTSTIVETNEDKKDIKEIDKIEFTKSDEEKIKPNFIQVGNIENTNYKINEEEVEISIYNSSSNEPTDSEQKPRRIIVDLDKAKDVVNKNSVTKGNETIVFEGDKNEDIIIEKNISDVNDNESIEKKIEEEAISNENFSIDNTSKENKHIVNLSPEKNNIPKNNTKTSTNITGVLINSNSEKENVFIENTEPIKDEIISSANKNIIINNTEATEEHEEDIIEFSNENIIVEDETLETISSTNEDIYINETETIPIENNSLIEPKSIELENSAIETTNVEKNISNEGIFYSEPISKIDTPQLENTHDTNKESGIFFNTENKTNKEEKVENENVIIENNTLENEETTENNNLETKTSKSNSTITNKKGSWSVGLGFGLPAVLGDFDSKFGYGMNLNIQKAIGHVFSLKFQAIVLETYGISHKKVNNKFPNYKTRFSDYTLQGVFTLNNLSFYKKEPKVIWNFFGGAGLATIHSWQDNLDANETKYNYDNISTNSKKETFEELKAIMDGKYETIIAKDENLMSIKNTNILPAVVVGLGTSIKLSKTLDLNIETRLSYYFNDNLDARKAGKHNDYLSYTSLGLTYKFPSKNKNLLWTNPVYSNIEEIQELKKKVDDGDLLKDEDKDGIADIFDQDLNTPEKVAVDSRGIPSDIDKDGVPDYKDSEPFTPLGAQVDENGIALDSDNDGIADVQDQEDNTLAGTQVDSQGRTIFNNKKSHQDIRANSDFELVLFDLNSFRVKREYYKDLYKIVRHIEANPSAKIEITGFTDIQGSEDFNLNLSEKRANSVYKVLIELFKIPSANLITNFLGEKNPIIENTSSNLDMSSAYYLNRRVEFRIVE